MVNGPSSSFEVKSMVTLAPSEKVPESSSAGMVPFNEFEVSRNSKLESDARVRVAKKVAGIEPVR